MFNQSIKFYVIQDSIQIPYNGILEVEFLSKNKVIIDFDDENLYFSNHRYHLSKIKDIRDIATLIGYSVSTNF